MANRCRELLGSVGWDEVAGTFDDDGLVVGKGPFPPPQFVVAECEVGVAPDDQRRQCRDIGQPRFDVGKKGAAGGDLAGKYSRGLPPCGAVEGLW